MGLSLLDLFILAGGVYAVSRVVSFFIDSNQASIRKRKEYDRRRTLEKLYGRDE
jgi:hypothetical protein